MFDQELVVVVIVDTLRWDALGCYGREGAVTPRIDALAAEGARFDQAIASSGWTLPSVASLLTGTWPTLHKATGKVSRLTPITQDLPVAAEVWKSAGYETLGFVNAAFLSPLLGLGRGFDVFDHRHAYNREMRRADETVDAALKAIDERAGEKVFLLVHLFDPHLDYDPPDGFKQAFVGERATPPSPLSMTDCTNLRTDDKQPPTTEDIAYIRGIYQGEVAFVDRAVGRLVDGLIELDRWDHTTFVLTADHGEEFWDHEGFEHGHTLYDELIRVPLILRLPAGETHVAHEVERQVRTLDIMPTLFDHAGITAPISFAGESFLGDLHGKGPERIPPAFSQSTLYGADKLSWRTERYHLIVERAEGAELELYDIVNDPFEEHDLTDELPQIRDALVHDLQRFSKDLEIRARSISTPELEDMGPTRIKEYLESLDALGYTGRDEDEDEDKGKKDTSH